jgi:RNA polymerase sigma-70 factor (ECF subfamily)
MDQELRHRQANSPMSPITHGLTALRNAFGTSDEDLMVRVRTDGDARAFATLVAHWQEPIYRLCARMTGDAHRGEDLKQETFARLFSKRELYQPTGKFSTYLWRIALNLCHDELRRLHRRREVFPQVNTDEPGDDLLDFPAEGPTPDLRAAQAEEGELVRQALLQLPEIYRTVLVLRHYQQLKLSEIADALEIPLGTVNSRMAEALARLARLLEPRLAAKPSINMARPPEILVI